MKKILFLFVILTFSLTACGQRPDGTIDTLTVNKIIFSDGTSMSSVPAVGQTVTWNTLAGKPAFHPVAISGSYQDLNNKPEIISLSEAINKLGYLPIPGKTTTEINNMFLPADYMGIVYDKTLKVYKLWDGQLWNKVIITNQ